MSSYEHTCIFKSIHEVRRRERNIYQSRDAGLSTGRFFFFTMHEGCSFGPNIDLKGQICMKELSGNKGATVHVCVSEEACVFCVTTHAHFDI